MFGTLFIDYLEKILPNNQSKLSIVVGHINPNRVKFLKELVKKYRESGGENARSCAHRSFQFRWVNKAVASQIVLPVVSSQRREYIPMSFIDFDTSINNKLELPVLVKLYPPCAVLYGRLAA